MPHLMRSGPKTKKFMLSNLRTLGGIKSATDGAIEEEISALMNKLRDTNEEAVDITDVLLLTTTNIISGILFNKRFDHDDPQLHELRDLIKIFYANLNDFSDMAFMLPQWLVRLTERKKYNTFLSNVKRLEDYIAREVEEHRKTLDADNPKDFVDMYLMKPDMEVGKGLYDTIGIFLPDSTDSISLFMRWQVLYLGYHPEIQKKAQAEIDEVVGQNQVVCTSMFYCFNLT